MNLLNRSIPFLRICEDGLFSAPAVGKLQAINDLDTKTVSDFMHTPFGDGLLAMAVADSDRVTLYTILDRMIERSALLAAAALAAAVLKEGGGDDPSRPVCIAAEGSTFFGLKGLQFRTGYFLKRYLDEVHHRSFEFVTSENATLIGAAVAGLTN